MKKNKTKILTIAVILLAGFLFMKSISQAQTAPTLSLGTADGIIGVGNTVTVPLTMSNNSSATGFNLDINYDPAILGSPTISASSALTSAGKSISSNVLSSGVFRVIVIGFNQTVIPNGVIASLTFTINQNATSGSTALSISNMNGTDGSGNSITLSSSNGSVTLSGGQVKYTNADFAQLATDWLKTSTVIDINNDGIVNSKDLGIMMHYWDK